MRPLAAVARLSKAFDAESGSGCHLSCCEACREALLEDIAGMFRPVEGDQKVSLEHSLVLGCTWSVGPVEACVLHPLLEEEEPCG